MDLTPFSWIRPCGLENVSMTSIKNQIKLNKLETPIPEMDLIKQALIENFTKVFNIYIEKNNDPIQNKTQRKTCLA